MGRPALNEMFHANESPYFAMFKAGCIGYSIEEVIAYLISIGVPVREKDIRNWQDGAFRHQMKHGVGGVLNPTIHMGGAVTATGTPFEESTLADFEKFPDDWRGTERRFFPCNSENMPMSKWGWSKDYVPQLYDMASAKALSPVGWVGQNMMYQRFIVMDIDGVGHGCRDEYVIAFGNLYRDKTMCMEDPAKPGSFHLYFMTDRIIPVKHFPWAKLDLMGNKVNAAVYLKNKVSNGLPMAMLTDDIWKSLMKYQSFRKDML